MNTHSRSSIDSLGQRLRNGNATAADIERLAEYRAAFYPATRRLLERLRPLLDHPMIHVTSRPAKTTTSIIAKLRRESIRLSQLQDIAGIRIVVLGIDWQDHLVSRLRISFPDGRFYDRRWSEGSVYRAVHMVVSESGFLIEIQIRTPYQHLWAELSEKLADRYGFALKYGGGPEDVRGLLRRLSQGVAKYEISEAEATSASARLLNLNMIARERTLTVSELAEIGPLVSISDLHNESLGKLRDVIRSVVDELKGRL